MPKTDFKQTIQDALNELKNASLRENCTNLLNTLGYRSDKTYALDDNTPQGFLETFDQDRQINRSLAMCEKWQTAELLFQLTDEELSLAKVSNLRKVYDPEIYQSYLFIAIELTGEPYSRTKLVGITREVNKLFAMPAMLLFKNGRRLTLAIINRRPGKRDASKDVLEKVTLIKDIDLEKPHRAHIEILHDLSLPELTRKHKPANFLDLHQAWQKTLDISELNKRFYREIADWYFWAMSKVAFPDDAEKKPDMRNATSLIRLITRLIFVWFPEGKGTRPGAPVQSN